MSICLKCGSFAPHDDPKTLCNDCVDVILKALSVPEAIELMGDVATKVRRTEARWKAKGAGYQ